VLIYSLIYPPDGVSTAYLYGEIVEGLLKAGNTVDVLTTVPHYNRSEDWNTYLNMCNKRLFVWMKHDDNFNIVHVAMPKKGDTMRGRLFDTLRWHFLSIIAFLLYFRKSYDVVITPSPPPSNGIIALWIAKICGARVVYNALEIYPDIMVGHGLSPNSNAYRALEKLEAVVYSKSTCVVTCSENFVRTLSDRIPATKLHMIPNFVDTSIFCFVPKTHHTDGPLKLVYTGNIGLSQDWASFIEVADLTRMSVQYRIAGGGMSKGYVDQKCSELALLNVDCLGYVDRLKIPSVLHESDVAFIMMNPKVDKDGFPSKIYTYMAAGIPVIAMTSRDSDMASLINAAQCGFVCPLGDVYEFTRVIQRYIDQPELLSVHGSNGRSYVETRYSKELVVEKWNTLINELASE